jgi:diguanylate cyclase (GGDEF)-like protein
MFRTLLFAGLAGIGAALAAGHLWLAPELAENVQGALVAALSRDILPDAWTGWTVLPDPALLVFAMAAAFLTFRMVLLGDPPLETGAFGALIAVGAALNFAGDATATAVFSTAAALILVAVALQDSYRLAFLDELTGLPGRRALKMESMKLGQRYAIAMLDIDHFKKFNDTYGHDVGDQVLRMVASRMMRVSGGGKPFRFGGEEFTILFPGKTGEEAFAHLDSLRETIAGSGFTIRDRKRPRRRPDQSAQPKKPKKKPKSVKVTISIGVAERGNGNSDPDAVIKAADQALYKAKKAGRNRVAA